MRAEKGAVGRSPWRGAPKKVFGERPARFVEKTLRALLLAGGTAAAFMPSKSFAVDTDRDGLPDSTELSIGTNPNNPDTDGDAFNDGIEYANSGGSTMYLDPSVPRVQFFSLDNPTSFNANLSYNKIMPALSHDETLIAYIRSNSDFTSNVICVSPITTPTETVLTPLYGDFDFNALTFSPDDSEIIFSDKDEKDNQWDLYAVDLSGNRVQLTDLPSGKSIRDPFIVCYPSSTKLGNWLFAATDNITTGATEITAFPYAGGNVQLENAVGIVDMWDGWVGTERWPKLDAEGRCMVCAIRKNDTEARTIKFSGIEDIVRGNTNRITYATDGRFDAVNVRKWCFPMALSPTGEVVFLSGDNNRVFNYSLKNFDETDFDFFLKAIQYTRIPFEGNQFSGVFSDDGTQVIYSSDDNFTTITLNQLYTAEVVSLNKPSLARENIVASPFWLIDPSGVSLELVEGSHVYYPEGNTSGTLMVKSIPLKERPIYQDKAQVIRQFYPDGMQFLPPEPWVEDRTSPALTIRYLEKDIPEGVDEQDLMPYMYNPQTGEFDIPLEVIERRPEANLIRCHMPHFSTVGLKATPALRARHWTPYR